MDPVRKLLADAHAGFTTKAPRRTAYARPADESAAFLREMMRLAKEANSKHAAWRDYLAGQL